MCLRSVACAKDFSVAGLRTSRADCGTGVVKHGGGKDCTSFSFVGDGAAGVRPENDQPGASDMVNAHGVNHVLCNSSQHSTTLISQRRKRQKGSCHHVVTGRSILTRKTREKSAKGKIAGVEPAVLDRFMLAHYWN